MRRRVLALALCGCLGLVAPVLAQNGGPPTDRPRQTKHLPDTRDNIHLEMPFNYKVGDPNDETGAVDMVWGSSYATEPAGVYNTAYIPYAVDDFTYSVQWYQQNHPDWLAYKCDGMTLAFQFGHTARAPLDFANPEVRDFQWSNWVDAPLAQGYSGIAVDNMTLTNGWRRCGHYDASKSWVQQYTGAPDDPAFRDDVLAWEAATYQHLHQYSSTATMQINVSYYGGVPLQENELKLMTTADLVVDERGFTNWGGQQRHVTTPAEWNAIVAALQYVQSKGLCYMTNGEEPGPSDQITQEERLWVIANYLLVKDDCTYMYISGFRFNGQEQDYGRLIIFPEYFIKIGHATANMRKTQGVWWRRYSKGLTIVNPYNHIAIVNLPPGEYVDVNGMRVGKSVLLRPQTGLVLLRAH